MDEKELDDILAAHKKWLDDEDGGKRADLSGADMSCADLSGADLSCADLSGADLSGADLSGAYLRCADLSGAYLRCADLRCADLSGADLSGADLRCADLRCADLSCADLSGADLSGADLSNAYLSYAQNIPPLVDAVTSILPAGEIVGWKIAHGALVKLSIPADARRSNATWRKCRCDRAVVTSITDEDGNPVESVTSDHDADFVYRVGDTVVPDSFDENRWDECSHGINFFITREEAIDYASQQ